MTSKNLVKVGQRVTQKDSDEAQGSVVTAYEGMQSGTLWATVKWDDNGLHVIRQDDLVVVE